MGIYYLTITVVFCLLLFSRLSENKYNGKIKQKGFIFLALFIIVVIAGLRWNVGTDFRMYNSLFHQYKNNFVFNMKIEPIFKLFCFIPGMIFEKSTMTFILIAIYTYFLVFLFCKKNCKYYDLAFFLFISMGFFFNSLNIVRQWMAIPSILLTYNYLAEKNYFRAFIFFILGYFCHYTVIILLPFLFFINVIKTEKTRLGIIVIAILSYIFSGNIMIILQNLIINISFLSKYYYYFSKVNSMNASLIIPAICLIVYAYYLILLKINSKKIHFDSIKFEKLNIYINVLTFAFLFTLLGTKIDVFERMQHFFYPIIIVIIPLVLEMLDNKTNKKIITILILFFGLAFFTNTMLNNGGEVIPYQTVITESE